MESGFLSFLNLKKKEKKRLKIFFFFFFKKKKIIKNKHGYFILLINIHSTVGHCYKKKLILI